MNQEKIEMHSKISNILTQKSKFLIYDKEIPQ